MENLTILLHLLVTLLTGQGVYSATSDFTLFSDASCKSDIYVDTTGTYVRWDGNSIRNCKMTIHKYLSSDGQICVKLTDNNMKDSDNKIEFFTSYDSSIRTYNKYSSTMYEKCTYSTDPYIRIQMDSTSMGSFTLKIFTDNSNEIYPTIVKDTFMTIGVIIGVVIGVIVLIIVVIVIIVCCCCMKGRRTQGHVYRQQGQPQATVTTTTQHQMVPQGQPQAMYPQQPGYPAQPVQYGGYPAQTQPVAAPSAPPSDTSGYMEKPPPYTT